MPNLDFSSFTHYLKAFTVEKVLTSLLILLVCLLVIKIITRLVEKLLGRVKRLDPRMNKYAMAALKVLLYILTALIVAQSLGIPTTSLVALFSVLSLAISLLVLVLVLVLGLLGLNGNLYDTPEMRRRALL